MITMNRIFAVFIFLVLATAPAFAAVSVTNGLVRNHTVQPGEAFEGIVTIRNSGSGTETVRLYQTDYRIEAGGKRFFESPGTNERSNAGWVSLTPLEVTVVPGETASVVYRGTVPVDAGLTGSFWSMIMVEPLAEAQPEREEGKEQISMGIRTVLRTAVQVATHIGDSGSRDLTILNVSLANEKGEVFLVLDVENTGERVLRPAVEAELYSGEGVPAGRVESDVKRIYPGSSVRHRLNLSDVPVGRYRALVVLDNGDDHVFGARYDLEIQP